MPADATTPDSSPPAKPGRVCVVVLNWNQAALTLRCLDTALAQDVPGVEVLVVDNGSAEADAAALRAGLPPGCRLLRSNRNLGFAGGMNLGIRYALRRGFEFVWLLNNDAFPEPHCLGKLLAAVAADPTLAAVTPRLVYPDGSAQSLGGRVDWETGELQSLPPGPLPRPTPVGWYVTGAALLLRADVLREVGGFDPRFFAYWEEFDLCTRILRRGGWNLGVVGGAECVHLERASSGVASPFVTHLMCRNAWLFVRKHRPVAAWPRLWLRFAAVQLVHAASLNAGGHPAQAGAVLSALWAGLTNRFHKPRRVVAPGNVSAIVLEHFWGVARRFWGVANWLSPVGLRRPPLGTQHVGGAA